MPELPDVEMFRRYLARTALRRRIVKVRLLAPEMVRGSDPAGLASRLHGRRLTDARRHGKYLFAGLGQDGCLVLHFGMTGELAVTSSDAAAAQFRYARLILQLEGGRRLVFADQRKLGLIGFTDDPARFVERRGLGADPMDPRFGYPAFRAAIGRARGGLKAMFLNQRVVAGVGNLYADEILFQARLHPLARADRLSDRSRSRLYRATRRVLKRAIDDEVDVGRMPTSWMLPHRQPGGRCPACGNSFARMTVGGRTTYYCPRDQRAQARHKHGSGAPGPGSRSQRERQ